APVVVSSSPTRTGSGDAATSASAWVVRTLALARSSSTAAGPSTGSRSTASARTVNEPGPRSPPVALIGAAVGCSLIVILTIWLSTPSSTGSRGLSTASTTPTSVPSTSSARSSRSRLRRPPVSPSTMSSSGVASALDRVVCEDRRVRRESVEVLGIRALHELGEVDGDRAGAEVDRDQALAADGRRQQDVVEVGQGDRDTDGGVVDADLEQTESDVQVELDELERPDQLAQHALAAERTVDDALQRRVQSVVCGGKVGREARHRRAAHPQLGAGDGVLRHVRAGAGGLGARGGRTEPDRDLVHEEGGTTVG